MLANVTPQLAWYVARASGLVAWAVVTASILWGLALSSRLVRRKGVPAWLLDLHRFLGTLSIVFVAVHLAALWADDFVDFGPKDFVVPMASTWRPEAVTWGVAATYLLVAIQLTSWMMRHLPRKLWHAIHLTTFPMFAASTVHGFQSGADRSNLLVQWLALTGGLMVLFITVFRVLADGKKSRRRAAASLPSIDIADGEAESHAIVAAAPVDDRAAKIAAAKARSLQARAAQALAAEKPVTAPAPPVERPRLGQRDRHPTTLSEWGTPAGTPLPPPAPMGLIGFHDEAEDPAVSAR
ncbi:MAG: ferric reductase-like transmembrane domain-containing protein [Acidimicrobiia bacterium]